MFYEHQLFILLLGAALTDKFIENNVLNLKMFEIHRRGRRGRRGTQRKIIH